MSSINNLQGVGDWFKAWVEGIVSSDEHAPKFARYGDREGVVVMWDGSQLEPPYQPYLTLTITSQDEPSWGRDAKRATIKVNACANAFSGAAIGDDTPIPTPLLLSGILETEFEAAYITFRNERLLNPHCKVTGNRTDEKDKAHVTIIEHECTFVFFTY